MNCLTEILKNHTKPYHLKGVRVPTGSALTQPGLPLLMKHPVQAGPKAFRELFAN